MKKIMFNEIWRTIRLNGCQLDVSNYGNVRFSDSKKPKAIYLNKYGYPTINVQKNKHTKGYRVHRLVALLFIENPCPDKYDCVNHKDENPQNNNMENLEWCDRLYNNNYGRHNERISKSNSKSIIQYDLNGKKIHEWASATVAAKELGYSQSGINLCCLRKPKHNTYKGFIWRYSGDNDIRYKNGKAVIKCDLNGDVIAEYLNLTTAARKNGILITSITNCIKGRSKRAGGFYWKLKLDI